jgi:HTH-type transcriptional regulator, sugar sensing transcriptional regulator
MDRILIELEKFGFSKIDGQVYITILRNPRINGSQVAKKINIPRTSVYSSIENLYQRGAIHLIPESSNTYIAKDPVEFIKKIKEEYLNSADYLEKEFENFECSSEEGEFLNIKGDRNAEEKIKEMIKLSQKEIYMNTNYDLENFKSEIEDAVARGVRVIMFSFKKQEFEKYPVEIYYNPKMPCCHDNELETKRVMIVVDCYVAFIGSGKRGEEYIATFSYNKLFVRIISEHIHHDIYLLGLEKEYGTNWYEKLKIGTIHEANFEEAIKRRG